MERRWVRGLTWEDWSCERYRLQDGVLSNTNCNAWWGLVTQALTQASVADLLQALIHRQTVRQMVHDILVSLQPAPKA